jgi:hypothetical protein
VDRECRVVGEGRTVVELPTATDVRTDVTPVVDVGVPLCDVASCANGRCMPGFADAALPDGGVDSAAEADADVAASDAPEADAVAVDAAAPAGTDAGDRFVFECETALLYGSVTRSTDGSASAGAFAEAPYTAGAFTDALAVTFPPPTRIEVPIRLPAGGTWLVEVRSRATAEGEDQLFIAFASQGDRMRPFTVGRAGWEWASGPQLRFDSLPAGDNALVLAPGHTGAGCDVIVISRDASGDGGL